VTPISRRLTVGIDAGGQRLDRWLAVQVPDLSRAQLQDLIEEGHVTVDGATRRPAHRLRGGERIDLVIPPPPPEALEPEPMALSIVHEDADVLVVDKPAGVVVHPGAGHAQGTLAAALLSHAPGIAGVGGPRRPGVVHRLDKDTSGLLVVAKTSAAYDSLTAQLAARSVSRRYVAIVQGRVGPGQGVIDAPIGRHPHDRVRMAVRPAGRGKRAVTHYRVLERWADFTYVEARLETGRTHQIRVHFFSIGHPIYGDEVYRSRAGRRLPVEFTGIALHAAALGFVHPNRGLAMEFSSPVPPRIERLLRYLRVGHGVC
jgi:23S rRNA pseudouridine1911/1915/1917 synthase